MFCKLVLSFRMDAQRGLWVSKNCVCIYIKWDFWYNGSDCLQHRGTDPVFSSADCFKASSPHSLQL